MNTFYNDVSYAEKGQYGYLLHFESGTLLAYIPKHEIDIYSCDVLVSHFDSSSRLPEQFSYLLNDVNIYQNGIRYVSYSSDEYEKRVRLTLENDEVYIFSSQEPLDLLRDFLKDLMNYLNCKFFYHKINLMIDRCKESNTTPTIVMGKVVLDDTSVEVSPGKEEEVLNYIVSLL